MRLVSQRLSIVKILVAVLAISTWLFAFSGGPPLQRTGGFGEPTCVDCHRSFPLNSGRALGGDFLLFNVPDAYVPGEVYVMAPVIFQPGQSRWGFELSVRDENGQQAGALFPFDETSQVRVSDGGIQYLSHTSAGTFAGQVDGPAFWLFAWMAPDTAVGRVFFHAAGNAANNNGAPTGDYIYTTSAVVAAPAADTEH